MRRSFLEQRSEDAREKELGIILFRECQSSRESRSRVLVASRTVHFSFNVSPFSRHDAAILDHSDSTRVAIICRVRRSRPKFPPTLTGLWTPLSKSTSCRNHDATANSLIRVVDCSLRLTDIATSVTRRKSRFGNKTKLASQIGNLKIHVIEISCKYLSRLD